MNKKPQFPMISVVGVILIVSATALWYLNPLRGFGGNQIFPISLRSSNYANYSQDPGEKISTSQQPLLIIEEVIRNIQEFFIPETIRLQSGSENKSIMTPTANFPNLFTNTVTAQNPTASLTIPSNTPPGFSPTSNNTGIPNQTNTPTIIPTETPTITPIFTETQTPTRIMTRTPNRTNLPITATFSPTNTFTPTYTFTPFFTATRTNTLPFTPTASASYSPTPIPPTRTPTPFIPTSTPMPTGYPAPSTSTPIPSTPVPTSPGYP